MGLPPSGSPDLLIIAEALRLRKLPAEFLAPPSQCQASLTFVRLSAFLPPAVMGLQSSPAPHAMAEAVSLRGVPADLLALLVMSLAQV